MTHLIPMQTAFPSNGRNIRLDVNLPATPGPHPAILILHGSGGNTGFWLDRIAPFMGRLNFALFAVHYFDATGTTRAEPAQFTDGIHVPLWLRAASDAVAEIARHPAVDKTRIAVVGVSLGAFMALAMGTDPLHPIRCIVDISGGLIEPWLPRADSSFPPTLILHGEADNIVPVANAHALESRLTSLGVPHSTCILAREGHWFSPAASVQLLGAIAQFLGRYL